MKNLRQFVKLTNGIFHDRKYSGQHDQCDIRAVRDGKIPSNTQRLSCILIGCIFLGMV